MKLYELAKNQTVVVEERQLTFFSYGVAICQVKTKELEIILSEKWNYSRTTTKWMNRFLNNYFGVEIFNTKIINRMLKTKTYNHELPNVTYEVSLQDII